MDNQQASIVNRRNHASEIITSGHVWHAVWFLAWPTVLNTLFQTAYNVINGIFVGRLPHADRALAAVGIGGQLLMIQFGITIALSVGTSALISRFLGAREIGQADEATGQSLTLAVLGGILAGIPLIIWAKPLVVVLGAEAHVAPVAADYTSLIAWFSVPMFIYVVATAALRSAGDVRSPLAIGVVVLTLNAALDWTLIFGHGPFPAMGVHGAAIATGISRIAAMFLCFYFVRRSVLGGSFQHLRPRPVWFRRILNIGWPAAIQNLLWSTASAVFLKVLGMLPAGQVTTAQAALTVGVRIESIAFMPGIAYSMAATPLVGQNLGAGKPDRAEHSAWVAVGQAVFVMTSVAVVFLAVPRWLALIFTTERNVVPLVVWYLRINAISEPFLAVGMVLRGALQGAGDTRAPAWITVATLWVLRLPLAWVLAIGLGYGAVGSWVAMSSTTILSGLAIAGWFRLGRWRTVQV